MTTTYPYCKGCCPVGSRVEGSNQGQGKGKGKGRRAEGEQEAYKEKRRVEAGNLVVRMIKRKDVMPRKKAVPDRIRSRLALMQQFQKGGKGRDRRSSMM